MSNAGSEALCWPSLTEITMFESVPTSAAVGVPLNCPLAVLNVAHAGFEDMENDSESPFGSDA
jgi:hypothetical protein